ncbi:MAG: transporter ATP-binding protein [Gammaproteobacteria bacterium]|jgi:teichoic acid transport system ATP-binding protein|nr:transporter ATP-binding protein [Gammaproteobacteria bacterium]
MSSNQEEVISVNNVSKCFHIYDKPLDRLKQIVGDCFGRRYYKEFWALKDVSFNIKRGEVVGILGQNGAGKSTLLQLICGILTPTSGSISKSGRIAALLELGTGFNPEFTGEENVFLYASILGLSQKEIQSKYQTIIDFADIGDFIKQPVKTYSSGMYVRLAFSVAVHIDPEILIVDEALAVGDMFFQAKCMEKMKSLRGKASILFVSHSLASIKQFCQRAILLEHGKVVMDGDVKSVTEYYETKAHQQFSHAAIISDEIIAERVKAQRVKHEVIKENAAFQKQAALFRSGTGEARFINLELYGNGELKNSIKLGEKIKLVLTAAFYHDIPEGGLIGYNIRNKHGVDIIGCNIFNKGQTLPAMKAGEVLEFEFNFLNILAPGEYTISIGLKPAAHQPLFFDVVKIARVFSVPDLINNYVPGVVSVENEITYKVHEA